MTKRPTRAAAGLVAWPWPPLGWRPRPDRRPPRNPRCTGAASYWTGFVHDTYICMPSGPSAYNCGMSRGEVGEEVRALQDSLNKCYGASLSVDGQFGPKTQAALKVAESTHGMTSSLGTYDSGDAVAFRFWGWYSTTTATSAGAVPARTARPSTSDLANEVGLRGLEAPSVPEPAHRPHGSSGHGTDG